MVESGGSHEPRVPEAESVTEPGVRKYLVGDKWSGHVVPLRLPGGSTSTCAPVSQDPSDRFPRRGLFVPFTFVRPTRSGARDPSSASEGPLPLRAVVEFPGLPRSVDLSSPVAPTVPRGSGSLLGTPVVHVGVSPGAGLRLRCACPDPTPSPTRVPHS